MKIFHEVEGIDPDAPKKTEERIGMKAVPGHEEHAAAETEKTVTEEAVSTEETAAETSSDDAE